MTPELKALGSVRRLEARAAGFANEIKALEAKVSAAAADWQAAISTGNAKLEMTTGKTLAAAKAELEIGKTKLSLLPDVILAAKKECLPELAREVAPPLEKLSEEALALGPALLDAFAAGRRIAKEIFRLYNEHARLSKVVHSLASELNSQRGEEPRFSADLGPGGHFPMYTKHLEACYKPKAADSETWLLNEHNLYRTFAVQQQTPEVDNAE